MDQSEKTIGIQLSNLPARNLDEQGAVLPLVCAQGNSRPSHCIFDSEHICPECMRALGLPTLKLTAAILTGLGLRPELMGAPIFLKNQAVIKANCTKLRDGIVSKSISVQSVILEAAQTEPPPEPKEDKYAGHKFWWDNY